MNSLYERKQWKSCLPREIKEIILSQFINHKLSVFSWKNFYPYRYEDEQVANRTGGFVLKTDKWVKEHYVQSLIESAEAIFLLKEIEDIEERFFSKELWML
jgi:ribosomal protein S19